MGVRRRRRAAVVVALAILPFGLAACGLGGADEPADEPTGNTAAEEAASRSRERVQAYLDAMTAKDVDAGRSQLCAPMHAAFDTAATGANGDFAEHFTVSGAQITDVRSGPRGQEVSTAVTVTVGTQAISRALLFTVTRSGADWCIAGEAPGGHTAAPTGTPGAAEPSPPGAP